MTEWAAKRFWTETRAVPAEGDAFTVELDGRRVRTPAKSALIVPTQALADEIAGEWAAQEDRIDPLSMPVTRSANAAIDKVATMHADVVQMLADYAGSDMLCYRAEGPDGLIARQAETWDPLLRWSAEAMQAPLEITSGIVPVAQPAESLSRYRDHLAEMTYFELAAMHDLISLSGSAVIGCAVAAGHVTAVEIWPATRLDELWQQEQWGVDEEAESMAATKRAAFLHAERFLHLSRAS
ncbi:ATP12 family chaperone protein [Pseudaestuariivita atlantica]|uniref:ATPase n=1 Tax=Pseudaestuariivita atlantica TaxID=1317121 RepID=A0A0L1JKK8_9RHOB|nr:ATP12 family protein [Pseudaestuariivita atlantica]KNG92290.1 ATPase [Pseudaestuariivita atlantica]